MDKTTELPAAAGTTGTLEEESKTLLNMLYEYRLYLVVLIVLVVLSIGGYFLYTKYYLCQEVEVEKEALDVDNFAEVHASFKPTNMELDQVKQLNKEQEAHERKMLEQELKAKLSNMNQSNNDRIQEDVTNMYEEPQVVQQYDLSQGELDNIANELAQ
jgi:recombination DNA repair RAD52 pathway protein